MWCCEEISILPYMFPSLWHSITSDTHYYKFELTQKGKLCLALKLSTKGDYTMFLYQALTDGTLNEITEINYNTSSTSVTGYVTENDNKESEFNNTLQTASKIDLKKAVTGNLSNNNDEDYYKIKLSSKKNIKINFKHSTKGSFQMTLFRVSSSGIVSEVKDYNFYEQSNSAKGVITKYSEKLNLTKGTYVIKIIKQSYYNYTNEDYTLKVVNS